MIQRHKMILWSKPKKEELKVTVDRAYRLMQVLRNFGSEISPNYETVYRKKDAKLFEWSYESFEQLVKNGVNREGKKIFNELGYSFSFFSSLKNNESAGISMHTGTINPDFVNTFILEFPLTYDSKSNSEKMILLFQECVKIFEPFWGCMANSLNARKFGRYMDDGQLPTSVHWLNFWGEDIIKAIGEDKIANIPSLLSEKLNDGYFLKFGEYPIDNDNDGIIQQQNEINNFLGLKPLIPD